MSLVLRLQTRLSCLLPTRRGRVRQVRHQGTLLTDRWITSVLPVPSHWSECSSVLCGANSAGAASGSSWPRRTCLIGPSPAETARQGRSGRGRVMAVLGAGRAVLLLGFLGAAVLLLVFTIAIGVRWRSPDPWQVDAAGTPPRGSCWRWSPVHRPRRSWSFRRSGRPVQHCPAAGCGGKTSVVGRSP